jgi:hypothetical protein
VQLEAAAAEGLRHDDFTPVPRDAFVLGVAADAPRVGHVHRLDAVGHRLRPAARLALAVGVDAELPRAVQVDAGRGRGGSGEGGQDAQGQWE